MTFFVYCLSLVKLSFEICLIAYILMESHFSSIVIPINKHITRTKYQLEAIILQSQTQSQKKNQNEINIKVNTFLSPIHLEIQYFMKVYLLYIACFTLLIVLGKGGLRFQDEQLMKMHHKQAYDKDGPAVTVHLIPHSHDDVGWLKTVDDYFYGGDQRTQFAGVQYTIDTVVSELYEHPQYKFSIVEVAFLYRWWNRATSAQKDQMKKVIQRNQLKFINGGWCMSDEANMYYEDFIDQMTIGLRWLKDTFNYVPTTAWHIDPFGHHASSATLFSQMGFQAFFFARIDYQDKLARMDVKKMEMIWKPPQYTNSKNNYIFTHVNYFHYSPPPQFCFDPNCRDEPIKDNPDLEGYNIDTKSQQLSQYFRVQAMHFRTNNLLHTLGQDFHFTNSRMWFKNFDKLLKYINSHPQLGVNIMYSTPDDYIQAVQKEKASYPVKYDDFFPYADQSHSFWTGYFTSRVALKGFVRDFGRYLQATRKHISELKISNSNSIVKNSASAIESAIFGMQMAMGILQHHDAVAGTAKQKVTDDYVSTGVRSINNFNNLYGKIKAQEIHAEIGQSVKPEDIYFNVYWNQTSKITGLSDRINNGKTTLVSLYNPGPKDTYSIRIKVPPKELNLVISSNQTISGDIICSNIKDQSDCDLFFDLKMEQSSNFYIKLVPTVGAGSANVIPVKQLTLTEQIKQFNFGTDKLKITRGNQSFELTLAGVTQTFKIFYNYYEGWNKSGQKSGAYIFRPINSASKQYDSISKIYYADGHEVVGIILEGQKIQAKLFFSKIQNYVRKNGFMVQTFVDSIPVDDEVGKEITLNIQTQYKNNNTFFTDSMGLQQQKRVLNYRPTWNYTLYQPTAGNYYPVNSFLRIQDVQSKRSITVMNDRSQGGSVLREGQIQIMIHRRLLVDDSRGVDEPLNQRSIQGVGLQQAVRHYVVFGDGYRNVQKLNDQRILPTFVQSNSNYFAKDSIRRTPITIPSSVKLYLRPFQDGSYLLRLHNINPTTKATVNIGADWKSSQVTLAANQLADDWRKKQFKWTEDQATSQQQQFLQSSRKLMELNQRDIQLTSSNNLLAAEDSIQAAAIQLLPFQLKAFKITK